MNEILNEVTSELQQILEELPNGDQAELSGNTVAGEPRASKWKDRLGHLLRSNPSTVPTVLSILHPILGQLPISFLDALADEVANVLRQDPECVDESALDFVEEALLRSSSKDDGRG